MSARRRAVLGGAKACCTPTKPSYSVSLTAPIAVAAPPVPSAYSYVNGGVTATCGALSGYAQYSEVPTASCGSNGSLTISFSLAKAGSFTVGQTVTFPNANASAIASYVDETGNSSSCEAWMGSVTWVSSAPSSKASFDLSCSTTGTTLHVAGTVESNT